MKQIIVLFALLVFCVGIAHAKPEMALVKGGTMDIAYYAPDYINDTSIQVQSYEMAKYEVTVGEFREFVKATGYKTTAEILGKSFGNDGNGWDLNDGMYWDKPGYEQSDNHPVGHLSWYDAVSYCNWRSKKDGLKEVYTINSKLQDDNNTNVEDTQRWTVKINWKANGYRLPTEAEWEYAARNGGKDVTYPWGNSDIPEQDGIALANLSYDSWDYDDDWYDEEDDEEEWYEEDSSGYPDDGYEHTAPVGSFPPNELGIYDLAGNVSEWCWNWFTTDQYEGVTSNELTGLNSSVYRTHRGSAWCDYPDEWPVNYRRDVNTDYMSYQYFGMRLVKKAK